MSLTLDLEAQKHTRLYVEHEFERNKAGTLTRLLGRWAFFNEQNGVQSHLLR